ncbi:Nn.00g029260.m01.CDS01 [Neocucurbitaria sp. VM-36]
MTSNDASQMESVSAKDHSYPDKEQPNSPPSETIVNEETNAKHVAVDEGQGTYLGGFKLVLILTCLCLCEFLVALDGTILATAIPVISVRFRALEDVGWYVSAYFLTNCGFQLVYGKFYSLYTVKPIYMTAVAIFELGSLICAVARSSEVFIFGRAIAGLGAAGIFSGSLICISRVVRPDQRAGFSGMIVSMYGVASVAGPLIGGALTSKVTWRWCFYMNLPIGGAALVGLLFFLHTPQTPTITNNDKASTTFWGRVAKFDPFGAVCFFGSIVSLLLALQLGGTTYPFSSGRIIALFVVFGILFVAFVVLQIYGGSNATVPTTVLKQRSIYFGMFYMFCIGAHFFILVYFIPIWFQGIRGDDALQSGIHTLPVLLAQTIFVVSAGIFVSVTGYYMPLAWASIVLTSIGAGLLTTLEVDSYSGKWIGYQIIYGMGGGVGYQQGITAAQTVLSPAEIAIGTAVMVFVQNFGGTIFISVANNVFVQRLIKNLTMAAPMLDSEAIISAGATGFRQLVPEKELAAVLVAYHGAVIEVFKMGLILACITALGAAGMEWRRAEVKKKEGVTEDSKAADSEPKEDRSTIV